MRKHDWTKVLIPAILAVILLFGSEAEASCIKWSDARGVIAKNGLLKPGEVRNGAMRRGAEVISINLCRRGGRYVYRLTVIARKKRVRDIVIDAQSGQRVGGRSSSKKRKANRIINRVKRNLRRHGINYY
jgi:hypothetical protein